MKLLVVAPQPFFSPRGTPFSVYYRTLISVELGCEIDFLTYGQGENVDIPNVRFYRTPPFSFLGPIKLGPSALKLFHDIFIFFWMLWLLIRNKYDVVHVHEEAVFFATFLKPLFRFKLLYDMHSSLPQQLTNFNFTKSKFLINTFRWLEDKSLAKSEAIITICPDLFDYVNKVLPGNNKNFLIENSILEPVRIAGCSTGQNEEASALPVAIPATFKHIAVYAGTLESYQGIDLLIDAIPLIKEKNPDIGFVIVGGTQEQVENFQRQANALNVTDNVIFTGRVTQNIARAYSNLATILLSPRSSGTNTPLKIYEQLASSIPLVATAIYSHTQVLTDDVAFLVEPTPQDIARGVLEATNPNGAGKEKAINALNLYNKEYARPVYVKKLQTVLEYLS
ncbi:glycosyltransferase [Desulfogranum marinum]|uniref:glycosyltransferase n=1 Tax=Desulfogranum marinum TaxID=453220 RepID=UPI0019668409|nr:glycosyltransferase [Desulfogranum marinum]MBM9512984.1 glycosyltransferase [Desulfogranum marinum]